MTEPVTKATPTTAERIRSAFARAGGAMLAVEGLEPAESPVHHLLDDGSFAITVPVDGAVAQMVVAAGRAGVQAVLEMTDYAPLPLREPVRSLVWVRGRLHDVPPSEVAPLLDLIASEDPNPALLQVNSGSVSTDTRYALMRLEIESVVAADSTGAESVGLSTLLQARPDPFCAMESCWLQHMESAHREVVARLASRLPAALRRGRVRPLGLDRYGVQLRVEGDDGDHDVRLPFAKPVDDISGLSQAIRVLMGCPFLNGLRARRL
ncbi:DUF2470 domain-containing protein [Mycolicibacterium moriokaense]|uniref:Prephenate dehydratase n=1 Tax=Mycolicibacterium moriokaense TaxID=39691 RepID=A0AAD1H770_9MYCO|nr:DUF2470 domain-containing protein [Mycolicibacterium moriokaense]MCV7042925.1 DUF2470 domain-containing protein [Mycolicibacterium moriokaense]ORB13417.1 DUF2470 domain-containing protein [Mycolicibacterium moriokaense]BBW99816.1 prephenate dehydratase [Mycolicibacterium moriokaense]